MADLEHAPEMALPTPNPDAQTTVNDFLDYTEFFPSDLVRSLTLIGDLDATCHDAVQQVHELTVLYGKLPSLTGHDRPNSTQLRKEIAQHLETAIKQRNYASAEADRLYEVTVRHRQRATIIRKKLHAQPEPPSRDPTPPPVSPLAQRNYQRTYERPAHLRLTFDAARNGSSGARPRDRHRKPGALPRHAYDSSDDESGRSVTDASPRQQHKSRDRHRHRHPKPGRMRAPGVLGTNVHSSIAGISTSNALSLLPPPPVDASPGSRWAPWMKLTQYEMAVLRKQMKKNAVWTPSLTMVNRELEKKHRTRGDYEREVARCEAAGEEILDEEPESLQQIMANAAGIGLIPAAAALDEDVDDVQAQREDGGNMSIRLKPGEGKDGKTPDRLSQRERAMRDAQELENATNKIQQAADSLKELQFISQPSHTPGSQKKRSSTRSSNKRKRDLTPSGEGVGSHREESVATQDMHISHPESKRPRLQLHAPTIDPDASLTDTPSPEASDEESEASAPQSPAKTAVSVAGTAEAIPNGNTVQIPLAPAGPGTPQVNKTVRSQQSSPTIEASKEPEEHEDEVPAQNPGMTAASSRPRRESVIPKAPSPTSATVPPLKMSRTSTPAVESAPDAPTHGHAMRPRSARGHVPTPKAQSEEPKPLEAARTTREARRYSVFSQSALTAPTATRTSSRRKPPPKGEVTAAENGQKTVTNVKRASGGKNKKKKEKAEEEVEDEEIGEDEPRYCICDDVSYGEMISCDNNCDKEWFHLPCVNINKDDLPSRRAKWYCPDCRGQLGIDAYGNPLVPPPLPGRRGNRGWST